MKRPFILVLVCVAALAALGLGPTWVRDHFRYQAQAQQQLDRAKEDLRQIIDDLKAPPEAIFYDDRAMDRIAKLRQEAYAAHGVKQFFPYANQSRPGTITRHYRDGNVSQFMDTDEPADIQSYSYEVYWLNRTPQACRTIAFAFKDDHGQLRDLLQKDRTIYEKEIRWRLLLLMESWHGYMAVAACEALAAAGERSDHLHQRLEQLYINPRGEREQAGQILRQCGWAIPPLPQTAASQPTFGADDPAEAKGDALPAGAIARLGETRLRHGLDILATAFSPDGLTLASCGRDNFVRLWDLKTGFQKMALPARECGKFVFVDNAQLVTQAAGGIQLWDLASGAQIMHIDPPKDSRFTLPALSPDKHLLAVGKDSGQGVVMLYELPSGKWLRTFEGFRTENLSGSVYGLAFTPDGQRIICRSLSDRTVILDVATGNVLMTLPITCYYASSFAISRDAKRIFNANAGNLETWSLDTGKMEKKVAFPKGLNRIAGSGNGFFIMAGRDGMARVDEQSLAPIEPRIETQAAEGVSISADGNYLACCKGPEIQIWDLATAQRRFSAEPPGGPVTLLGFSQDGNVLHALAAGKLFRWDLGSGLLLPEPIRESVSTAAISPAGDSLIAEGGVEMPNPTAGGTALHRWLKVWDLKSGEQQAQVELPEHGGGRLFVGPARPGTSPLVVCGDGTMCLWDRQFKRPIARAGVGMLRRPDTAAWLTSKDGDTRLAVVGPQPQDVVQLYRFGGYGYADGPRSFNPLLTAVAIAASADGPRLLAVGYRRAAIWDLDKGREYNNVDNLTSPAAVIPLPWSQENIENVNSMLWLEKDGLLLINRQWNAAAIDIVDLRTGDALGRLMGHRGPVVSMLRRGDKLYTGSADTTVLVWDLKPILGWCQQRRDAIAATTQPAAPTRPAVATQPAQ